MNCLKERQIVDLIKNRSDLNYVQIALYTGTNVTAVQVAAKRHNCQRKRGRRPWKSIRPVTKHR
jgi:hypothetical protein